jgi:hypothetical protein
MPSTFFVETAIYRVSLMYSFRRDKSRLYMKAFWLISKKLKLDFKASLRLPNGRLTPTGRGLERGKKLCYKAVYYDQGWDGLLLFLRYKVGCSDRVTNIKFGGNVGLRFTPPNLH